MTSNQSCLRNAPNAAGPINYSEVTNPTTHLAADPFGGLPNAANAVSVSKLLTNIAVNETTAGQGPASYQALTGTTANCIKVLPPSMYANPRTGYPIIGLSYLLFNSAGNGTTNASNLRYLTKSLTTPTLFKHPGASAPISTVDETAPVYSVGTTGYTSLPENFSATIQSTANACIGQ